MLPNDRSTHEPAREEIARVEVGHTTVSTATARTLVAAFLAALVVAPVLEVGGRIRAGTDAGFVTAWSHLAGLAAQVPAAWRAAPDADPGAWARIVAANRAALAGLEAFEHALEEEAAIGRRLRPPAQRLLSGWLGAGNERAYIGRDGWLFFRPDVEYVTGPGFLEPAVLARRVAGASEWADPPQPDPRDAILHFKRQLDARGIALVVMPTPLKPTVHPERLASSFENWPAPVQNPSYAPFVEDLRRAGVLVFDVSAALVDPRRRDGAPQYLATDTHWRPETLALAVRELAAFLTTHVSLPPAADPGYRTEVIEVRHLGDLGRMLDLPEGQSRFEPDTVAIRRVLQPDGSPWRPSRPANVLVLGDSFSNIYSLASMGWGDSAGFVEQLSDRLRRPVDRIVQNDDGAFATREMLRRDLARGVDRLAGTRVVVYQFAARELATGDWQIIELPARPRRRD